MSIAPTKNATHFLNDRVGNDRSWKNGWTHVRYFRTWEELHDKSYVEWIPHDSLFFLQGGSGRVRIRRLDHDGSIGPIVYRADWTPGWSTISFYEIAKKTYVLLLKKRGKSSLDKNVHIHRMLSNGKVGDRIQTLDWTEGWTHALPYVVGQGHYLLILKSAGFSASGHNAVVHRLRDDGRIGARTYKATWTEGWTSLTSFGADTTYVLLAKKTGYGSSGSNVHIHRMTAHGEVGKRVAEYRWRQGTTAAHAFQASDGRWYLFRYKRPSGAVIVHQLDANGRVGGDVIRTINKPSYHHGDDKDTGSLKGWGPFHWSKGSRGWKDFEFFRAPDQRTCFVRLRSLGTRSEIKVRRVNPMKDVGPMVAYVSPSKAVIWAGIVGGPTAPCSRGDRVEQVAYDYRVAYRVAHPGSSWSRVPMELGHPPAQGYYAAAVAALDVDPDTRYRFVVRRHPYVTGADGQKRFAPWENLFQDPESSRGGFRTPPVGDVSRLIKVVVASCMDVGGDRSQALWQGVIDFTPELLLITGDTAYPNTTRRCMQWAEHVQQRSVPTFARVIRTIPTFATWDDHDFGPNQSFGVGRDHLGVTNAPIDRKESLQTFKELFPGPPYVGTLYYTFAWGPIQFFVLDCRYHRHHFTSAHWSLQTTLRWPPSAYRPGGLLGLEQRRWLEGELDASLVLPHIKYRIVVSSVALEDGKERWQNRLFEKRYLAGYLADYTWLRELLAATPGALLVSGDIHKCTWRNHGDGVFEVISSGIAVGDGGPKRRGSATLRFNAKVDGQNRGPAVHIVCHRPFEAAGDRVRQLTLRPSNFGGMEHFGSVVVDPVHTLSASTPVQKTAAAPRVLVVAESKTGRNVRFRDASSGQEMTRAEFVKAIKAGRFPAYYVRNIWGVPTPVSKPNASKADNLG